MVSNRSDRVGAESLEQATVSGNVYVFVLPDEGVTSVAFYLDDPAMTGAPYKREFATPFDLNGTTPDGSARAFDADKLSPGAHTLSALVTFNNGATASTTAGFNVAPRQSETVTLDLRVGSGRDDAYHDPAGWPSYSDSASVVYAGAAGREGPTWGGWRWTGLDIPAGAVIVDAYVELNQSAWGYTVETRLAMEDSANPAAFSSGDSPADRWSNRSDSEVAWLWSRGNPGDWHRTPSLAGALQELVDRHGRVSSVVLLEGGVDYTAHRYHNWTSFDGSPANAAKLHVVYRTP